MSRLWRLIWVYAACSGLYVPIRRRLSLLTMTNPNQLCEVLLFVCSKIAYETNLSSKLPVADRSEEESSVVNALALAFRCARFCSALLIFFCFVFSSTPSYEASSLCSILCNLFPRLCWYVEVYKGGFEGVLVSLFLTTMGAFSTLYPHLLPHLGFSLASLHQAFW